jgi:hypothetical protein
MWRDVFCSVQPRQLVYVCLLVENVDVSWVWASLEERRIDDKILVPGNSAVFIFAIGPPYGFYLGPETTQIAI